MEKVGILRFMIHSERIGRRGVEDRLGLSTTLYIVKASSTILGEAISELLATITAIDSNISQNMTHSRQ